MGDEDETTELVSLPARRSRLVLVFAAMAGAGTVVAVAVLVLGMRTRPESKEDALTLYQVARELQQAGESTSALQMIERARAVAETPRALRQIEELAREIRAAPLLARARESIDKRDYEGARVQLESVFKEDPENEEAQLLMRIVQTSGRGDVSGAAATAAPRSRAEAPAVVRERTSAEVDRPLAADRQPIATNGRSASAGHGAAGNGRRAASSGGRRRAAALYVDSSEPATLYVDGARRGRTPGSLVLPPGTHLIELVSTRDPKLRANRRVVLAAGRSLTLRVELPQAPPADPSAALSSPAEPAANAELEEKGQEAKGKGEAREPPERRTSAEDRELDRMPPTDNINPWSR